MSVDPMESLLEDYMEDDDNYIESMETSATWNNFRLELAEKMYESWRQTNV